MSASSLDAAADEAVELLRELVRIDSSNPPGNERGCAELLAEWLECRGVRVRLLERSPGRTNLVARRSGDGSRGGALLLNGHLDVVPADTAGWRHPPFSAAMEGGFIHGRGTVDMKNHVAACAAIMALAARQGWRLERDLIFAAVADEEQGGRQGAKYLVDEHAEAVRAAWALGELGGFTVSMGGKRLYPIQIAQKGVARFALRTRGEGGHGSMPRETDAVRALARALARLDARPARARITPPVHAMFEALGEALGGRGRLLFAALRSDRIADRALAALPEPGSRRALGALLRDTVAVTSLRAGEAPNVLPRAAEASLDGRFLPGGSAGELTETLRYALGDSEARVELLDDSPAVEAPLGTPLYRELERAIQAMDPLGIPFPSVTPGTTDAAAFARLGTRWYGFTPFALPARSPLVVSELYHGVDERIPIDGYKSGVRALARVVFRFCGGRAALDTPEAGCAK